MSQKTLRILILILGIFTAIVHLVFLPIRGFDALQDIDYLFILNGLGYIVLLVIFFTNPHFDQGRTLYCTTRSLVIPSPRSWHALCDGWAPYNDPLAWVTKLDEILLIVALILDMRIEQKA
jgi:hypothetical protein